MKAASNRRTASRGATLALITLSVLATDALAAERVVLAEKFTATW